VVERHNEVLHCREGVLEQGEAALGQQPWVSESTPLPDSVPDRIPERWVGVHAAQRRLADYHSEVRGSYVDAKGDVWFVLGEPVSQDHHLYHATEAGAVTEVALPPAARPAAAGLRMVGDWLVWQEAQPSGSAFRAVRVLDLDARGANAVVEVGATDVAGIPRHSCLHEKGLRLVLEGSGGSTRAVVQSEGAFHIVRGPRAQLSVDGVEPHVPKLLSRFTCTDSGFTLSWGSPEEVAPEQQVLTVQAVECSEKNCRKVPPFKFELDGLGMFPTVPVVPIGDQYVAVWTSAKDAGIALVVGRPAELEQGKPQRLFGGRDVRAVELFSNGATAYAVLVFEGDAGLLSVDASGNAAGVLIESAQR
jgi:hypothetical protein